MSWGVLTVAEGKNVLTLSRFAMNGPISKGMVVVDTSAWNRYFGHQNPTEDVVLTKQIRDEVDRLIQAELACQIEPIFLECATVAQSEEQFRDYQREFINLPLASVDRNIWATAAQNIRRLAIPNTRRVRAIDMLVATVAIKEGLRVFHHDKDYPVIARHLPLDEYSFL